MGITMVITSISRWDIYIYRDIDIDIIYICIIYIIYNVLYI